MTASASHPAAASTGGLDNSKRATSAEAGAAAINECEDGERAPPGGPGRRRLMNARTASARHPAARAAATRGLRVDDGERAPPGG